MIFIDIFKTILLRYQFPLNKLLRNHYSCKGPYLNRQWPQMTLMVNFKRIWSIKGSEFEWSVGKFVWKSVLGAILTDKLQKAKKLSTGVCQMQFV